MNLKLIQNEKIYKNKLKFYNMIYDSKVSLASSEIMLDRVFNGKEIDFPFAN